MSELHLLSPQAVMRELPAILFHITPAIDRSFGRYEPGDIIAKVLTQDMQCWVSATDGQIESVAITHILVYPRARVLSMPFIGGKNMKSWIGFADHIIKWAKERGCTQIEGYDCRGGAWLRVTDWQEHYITIGKEI